MYLSLPSVVILPGGQLKTTFNFNYLLIVCRAVQKITDKFPGLIEIPKEDGFTALHLAAFNNHLDIARCLLLSVCELYILEECDTCMRRAVVSNFGHLTHVFLVLFLLLLYKPLYYCNF